MKSRVLHPSSPAAGPPTLLRRASAAPTGSPPSAPSTATSTLTSSQSSSDDITAIFNFVISQLDCANPQVEGDPTLLLRIVEGIACVSRRRACIIGEIAGRIPALEKEEEEEKELRAKEEEEEKGEDLRTAFFILSASLESYLCSWIVFFNSSSSWQTV